MHRAERLPGGTDFRRIVRVVVYDDHAVRSARPLQPAFDSSEVRERVAYGGKI